MVEGDGYNLLTGKTYDQYVTYNEQLKVAGDKNGATVELLFKKVTSTAELNKVLGIDAGVNLNASWFTGQASLKAKVALEYSEKTEEFATFSVLYVKVREAPQMLRGVNLSPEILKFLNKNGLDEFYRRAGYEYIAGIIPGGEFISTIKITSNNRETKEKVDAALEAQISVSSAVPSSGSFGADVDLKSTFSQLAKNSEVQIEARCYRQGGEGWLVTNPEDALKYALDFPASLRQSPSILQVICKPYHDLLNFPTALKAIDMMALQPQQRALQELWDIFQQRTKTLAEINNILLNPMQFHGVEEDVLRKRKRELEHQLDGIAKNATKYANNPQNIRTNSLELTQKSSFWTRNIEFGQKIDNEKPGSFPLARKSASIDFPPISIVLPPRRLVELKSVAPSQKNQAVIPKVTVTTPSLPAIKLQTAKADFHKLDQLLSKERWQEADQETAKLMLKCANKERDFLDQDDCHNFPQEELRIMDQLWLKYSQDRFGFSVQKKIWVELGGKLDGYSSSETYCKLEDKVGWSRDGKSLNHSFL